MISIIIVNYNGKKYLDGCIKSIEKQIFRDFEIILVDNGSSDSSTEYIKKHFPNVILIENKDNFGFAKGTNIGIANSKGEFIFTLNNDTILESNTIKELESVMGQNPDIGMCGTKMVYPNGSINSTGICISRSGCAWDRGMGENDHGQYDKEEEIFGPCAGAALYRKSMLDEIGLFDEDFFLYMEDVDLAFRARLSGWKCLYIPKAQVTHIHGGTSGLNSDISIYYGNRNLFWYTLKNFPLSTLIISSPWIIWRNLADIPYYMIKRKSLLILKSKIDMIKGSGLMIKKRRSIKRSVSVGEIERWIRTMRY